MSSDLILHHFDLSPFAEKIRMVLGCKAARWRSVKIPMAMPKPDVVALTGGHRRTPLLQIGADVWCDTALIARVLDRHLPSPLLHPPEQPLAPLLAQWADWTLFWSVSNFLSQPSCLNYRFAGLSAEERAVVAADRDSFRAKVPRVSAADTSANLRQYLGALEAQLGQGGEFLCGPLTPQDEALAQLLLAAPEPFIAADARSAATLFNATGRRSRTLADCQIAAVALRCGVRVATGNVADFTPFQTHGLTLA